MGGLNGVRAFSRRREFTPVRPSTVLVIFTNKSIVTIIFRWREFTLKREFTPSLVRIQLSVDSRQALDVNSRPINTGAFVSEVPIQMPMLVQYVFRT